MSAKPVCDREQLARIVTQLGLLLQCKSNRTARSKARITKLMEQLAAERARVVLLNARNDELILRYGAKIFAFCAHHPELRRGRNVELGSGTGQYRMLSVGALVFHIDETSTIAEIKERFPELFVELVRTTYALDKNRLKHDYPKVLAQLTTASAPTGETFTVKPAVTEEVLRVSVSRLHAMAEALGLVQASLPKESS